MNSKCIFCLEDKPLTDEHIIPDSIGGSLYITAVCKDCNSHIGTDIDGPFINSMPVSLPRFTYDVPGKSGAVPNPFGGVGISVDGLKVRLDDDFKPHILPSVEEETTPSGDIAVRMIFDKADEPRLSEEVLKKARRVLKKKYPSMPDTEIETNAQALLADARKQITVNSSRPTLQYQFSVDITAMRLEYIYKNLIRLGVNDDQARMVAASRKGPWALSNMKPLKIALSNRFLAGKGFLGLLNQHQALGKAM